MDNLDEFNVAVARILADLLEAFPVPRSLNYTLADARPADVDRDVMNATVEWLAAEGLLRVTGAKHGGNTGNNRTYIDAVLTNRALQILGATPSSLKEPLGNAIKQAVKDGALDGIKRLVGVALASAAHFVVAG